MNRLTDILGKKYNESFFSSAALHSKTLSENGILVFKEFISKKILKEMLLEARCLKKHSFSSISEYNVYIKPNDESFELNSPRNRLMKTTKKCVANDLISKKSYLMIIYNSKLFQKFICSIVGANSLYPYSDNLSSVNINYYEEGDSLGWHFDNSDFTITLLIKNCEKGGIYQYFTDMRYDKEGNENYKLVEDVLNEKISPNVQSAYEGDLMIFKGNKSLHRVTEVKKGERILVTFNYNNKKGLPLSEQSRMTFFGRTV